jgi:large subunit ribosomal protein L21
MYAIVEIAGQQFKVTPDKEIFVNRLKSEVGSRVEFDKVLFYKDDNDNTRVGEPVADDILVLGRVVEHLKGDKVIVFKKKRRKGYQKSNGYRPYLTRIFVEDMGPRANVLARKDERKEIVEPQIKKQMTPTAKKKTATTAKKAPAKKAPAKKAATKTTAKKVTAKKPATKAKPKATAKAKPTAAKKTKK